MNNEQNKDYINLVKKLINCVNQRETNEILRDNFDYIDVDFLRLLQQEALRLQQEGNSDKGNSLKDIVSQLVDFLGIEEEDLKVAEFEDTKSNFKKENRKSSQVEKAKYMNRSNQTSDNNKRLAFLNDILCKIRLFKGNLQEIYLFFLRNVNQFDEHFIQTIENWQLSGYPTQSDAELIRELGNLINQFPLGDKAINLEIGIACYQAALQVYQRDQFPQEWARTQHNLAIVYRERIKGDKADNIEKAIAASEKALQILTKEALPVDWASIQNNLATAYYSRIKGDRADNIEKAISGFTNALQIQTQTKEALPIDWAMTQNNLTIAYRERIKGNKADNLEKAIAASEKALQIFTKEALPVYWARTQHNLANAYKERIKGDKADNLEKAIASHENALQILTKKALPIDWASTQNNLASVYRERIKGDKADNLEKAIAGYKNALQIRTKEALPVDWASTQNNLANAYRERIKGDKADNLEKAIISYKNALQICTKEALPVDWAITQNNLAIAYFSRIKGDRADNLEKAIAGYKNALQICTKEALPVDWASTQNNLANAYSIRIKGDKADNIEKAIAASENALQIRTKEALPIDWASTQNNLANAYGKRIKGDKADNIEKAISAFTNALQIQTKEALPIDWAMTQNNLGEIYTNRIKGDKADNIEKAIQFYTHSLQIFTSENFPFECLKNSRNLGNLGFKNDNWKLGIEGYSIAIEAIENLRGQAISEINRQQIMTSTIEVYQKIVQSYINLGKIDKAIEYAERSKTRDLVELLANRDLYPKGDISQTVIIELDKLRKEIVKEEKQLATQEMSDNLAILTAEGRQQQYQPQIPNRSKLNQLKQKLEELITRHITPEDPNFSLTQKVEPISFNDIKTLIYENTAIIQWYVTNDKILTFIIAADSEQPIIKQFPFEDRQALIKEISNYLNLYNLYRTEVKQEWQNQLESILENFAQYLHLDEIISELPQECNSLILIPHRFIHLLPIHALKATRKQKDETNVTGYLLDLFPNQISYAPSCQLLQLVKNQEIDNFNNLFGIQNPTDDLQYTDIEVDTIRQLFKPNDKVLVKDYATKENLTQQNLNQTSYSHFSSHGYFNFQEPLKSALILANSITQIQENINYNSENFTRSPQNQILDLEKCLTLGEIFNLDLRNCSLVTLSACETGLTDLVNVSDEYISLPSGFLFAGCTNVVSSLWAVNDLSTAFLMIKFYQNHKQENLPVTKALNEAQKWLRDVSKLELQTWIAEHQLKLNMTLKMHLRRRFYNIPDDARPFQSPFYWAAFCAIGK